MFPVLHFPFFLFPGFHDEMPFPHALFSPVAVTTQFQLKYFTTAAELWGGLLHNWSVHSRAGIAALDEFTKRLAQAETVREAMNAYNDWLSVSLQASVAAAGNVIKTYDHCGRAGAALMGRVGAYPHAA
jgi:hypothetical protein